MTNEQVSLFEKAIGDGSDFPYLTNDPIVNFNIDLEMGLDQALESFEASPNTSTISSLLMVAVTYWNDDMIGDEEFGEIVARCARVFDDEPEITSWDDLDEGLKKTYIEEAASIGSE